MTVSEESSFSFIRMMQNHHATKTNDDDSRSEWEVKYDKKCIPIENALPMIEISRQNEFF